MVILEDSRQQTNKHKTKHDWFAAHGVEIVRTKLVVGDYTLPTDQSVCIDTKKDLVEVCTNVTQQHRRFVEELDRAKHLGIQLIVLVEEDNIHSLSDIEKWKNPRRFYSSKALNGKTLTKILRSMEERHGCRFVFCRKSEAGKVIMDILSGGGLKCCKMDT